MNSQIKFDASVSSACQRLVAEDSTLSWILLEYADEKQIKLRVKSEGSLGVEEFVKQLDEESVSWGVYKVRTREQLPLEKNVVKSYKCILVKYVGANCSVIKRMLVNSHKGAINRAVRATVDLEVSNKNDITESAMIEKLKASGCVSESMTFQFTFWNFNSNALSPRKPTVDTTTRMDVAQAFYLSSIGLTSQTLKECALLNYDEGRDSDYFLVDGYFS